MVALMSGCCNCNCKKVYKVHSEKLKAILIQASVITDRQESFQVLVEMREGD